MMNDCIFCKIANGEIPSHTVYEDERFRAILDIAPASFGHTLILPKSHSDDLFGLDDETAAHLLPLAKALATKVKAETGCAGINILQNNGAAAGQTVLHYHLHIIPRMDGDGVLPEWAHLEHDPEAFAALAGKIKG